MFVLSGFNTDVHGIFEAIRSARAERGLPAPRSAVVLGMLKEKLPLEMIARVSDISLDKIREIGRLHSLL